MNDVGRIFEGIKTIVHDKRSPQCFACVVQSFQNEELTYPQKSSYLCSQHLPPTLTDEFSKGNIRLRIFFDITRLNAQSSVPSFFNDAAREKDLERTLVLVPYFGLDAENAQEPLYLMKARYEAQLTLFNDSTTPQFDIFTTEWDAGAAWLRQAFDDLLRPAQDQLSPESNRKTQGMAPTQVNLDNEAGLKKALATIQHNMLLGNYYLFNLSTRIFNGLQSSQFCLSSFLDSWKDLRSRYGVFIDIPQAKVLSFSPERFLAVVGDDIVTEPIKGTRCRSKFLNLNSAANSLWESEKEMCEHSMVVDLLRNDLNSVCLPGSVHVHEPFCVRIVSGLLQMQSQIFGKLKPGINIFEVLRAMLPAGSVTGTPKKSVCEGIEKLEDSPRGYYTGVCGWFESNNTFESTILIRSHFCTNQGLYSGVGAGITTLSDPGAEIQEFKDKLSSFFRTVRK